MCGVFYRITDVHLICIQISAYIFVSLLKAMQFIVLILQAKMELNDGNLLTLSEYLLKTLSPDASVRKPGMSSFHN